MVSAPKLTQPARLPTLIRGCCPSGKPPAPTDKTLAVPTMVDSAITLEKAKQSFEAALPWIISILFHAVLFLLMALIVWVVQATATTPGLPLAEATLADYIEDGFDSPTENPTLAADGPVIPVEMESFETEQLDLLSEVAGNTGGDISIIGIGAGAGEGDLTGFGLAGGVGEGPSFFGLGKGEVGAKKICYVVDRSGSMVETLNYVKDEVKRSVGRLNRTQEYHIMFFSSGPPVEVPPRKMVSAIRPYKKRSFDFLDTLDAAGSTDPVPAMARAFQLEPDLIYFLTDGEFSPDLIQRLRVWNSDEKVKIYTIAYISRRGEDLLRQIARENGGQFTYISSNDLN